MAWASENRKKLNKQSKTEEKVSFLLDDLRIFYHRNWGFQVKGGKYRFVDFFIRKHKFIIEIDGPEHDKVKDLGREQEIKLTFRKYSFLRFTNDEVNNNIEYVKNEIMKHIIHKKK